MLIHGLGGSHHTWDRVIPLIEAHARIYALDLPGTSSIEDEADAAAELIPGPAVLVGHSRGGLVASAIAECHPDLARTLILLCTPWAPQSRISANRPAERALAIPGIGQLAWAAATRSQQRRAAAIAFAPNTPVPEQFLADLRATGRHRLVAASHAKIELDHAALLDAHGMDHLDLSPPALQTVCAGWRLALQPAAALANRE